MHLSHKLFISIVKTLHNQYHHNLPRRQCKLSLQNGDHKADFNFEGFSLNENIKFLLRVSLNCVVLYFIDHVSFGFI